MLFRQVTHDDLGCASYLVGDTVAGVAAVVDPRLDVSAYLDLARYLEVRIEHILETHNHADHVSGHGRLRAATGATVHIHREAGVAYEHEPFEDGWELELGVVLVRAVHAPGHRPEHTAFALIDTSRGPEPWAMLTGDSLFVGDVARPDLAVERDDGARGIYRSLNERLLTLDNATEVWPGHLGGSLCGGPDMDMKPSSTIGYERRHNELLAVDGEEEFVQRTTSALAPQPPNFEAIVALNRGPFLTDFPEPRALAPGQVDERLAAGATVVDVRASNEFDEAHIPGSLGLTTGTSGFGTQLAWLVDPDIELMLVAADRDEARRAAGLAAAVGVRSPAGYRDGGLAAGGEDGRPVRRIERIDVAELARRRAAGPPLQILDVREDEEWREGHIRGSVHRPYHDIRSLPKGLDPERPVAVICASGQRSAVGASLVERHGAREVLHVVDGGVPSWQRLGHPVERDEPSAAPA